MRLTSPFSAALLFPLLSLVEAQTRTTTSLATGVFATVSGGSTVTLPTTMTYTLTLTGDAANVPGNNNNNSGSNSNSGSSGSGSQSGSGTGTNRSASKTSTSTKASATADAPTDIPLGGGGNDEAPLPGESHKDIYGPDDNFVAAAPKLLGAVPLAGVAVAAGLGGWFVLA